MGDHCGFESEQFGARIRRLHHSRRTLPLPQPPTLQSNFDWLRNFAIYSSVQRHSPKLLSFVVSPKQDANRRFLQAGARSRHARSGVLPAAQLALLDDHVAVKLLHAR